MKSLGLVVLFICFLIITGCSNVASTQEKSPTISNITDSKYTETFNELNLGTLFDYNLYLPHADKRWVRLWVEKYQDGKKEDQPVTELSYGMSVNKVDEGHLGFGMLSDSSVLLYGPNVNIQPEQIDLNLNEEYITSWGHAIEEGKEIDLELGKTKLLAAYWQTASNKIPTIDFQNEDDIANLIKENEFVLLLKIKIDEEMPD
ncbi:hypothetical protein QNH47_08960 [Virgibacillus halodenitrificans]|uniref:hypothetical protein n=1 Tax=Virgibacillus halodenitrificans TaxID=1482 RepID=UPI0024C0415B|nr:hypothetical protein [Virgibacillus halodenitrificans]WHX27957.1 hypothetical protein QNH47_08960 [Virgibacillus halodenitrificans]